VLVPPALLAPVKSELEAHSFSLELLTVEQWLTLQQLAELRCSKWLIKEFDVPYDRSLRKGIQYKKHWCCSYLKIKKIMLAIILMQKLQTTSLVLLFFK